jgi:hypothetical protein
MTITISENIEQQLLNNVAAALDARHNAEAKAEELIRLAHQDFKDAVHTAFKYGMRPETLISLLDDAIEYPIDTEILNEYKPKNRRAWRESQWAKQPTDSTTDQNQ